MVWRGRRSCEPPLLGHLSHNYASPVVCLDLLWCIRARIYTRDWSPRGHDRNLESPRKSTLDFRQAGRDINDSRATRTKSHGRRLRGASPRYVHRASLWSLCPSCTVVAMSIVRHCGLPRNDDARHYEQPCAHSSRTAWLQSMIGRPARDTGGWISPAS